MNYLTIESICEVVRGSSPRPQGDPKYYGGSVPRLMVADLTRDGMYVSPSIDFLTEKGALLSRPMRKGDVVIAVSGNPGLPAILNYDACIHDGFVGLRNLNEQTVDKEFLYYFLLHKKFEIKSGAVGAIFKNLTTDQIKAIQFPNVSLNDQQQIVSQLKQADIARQKRKAANALTDQFLQGTFLSMFGDPITNEKNWERGIIRDVVTEVKYGTSKPAEENGSYPYLRMNNIDYSGNWDFSSLKFINLENDEREKYLLRKDDLVFNRTNSKELVGKTAVYNLDKEMAIAGYLIRVRTNERANSYYLWAYLNSKHGKSVLFNMCKNIVGMANINAQELQDIQILIPPIFLQQKFASIVADTEQLRQKQKQSEIELENLFQALLQKYFG